MNISVITLSLTKVNKGKTYSLQDEGLAKELIGRGHDVTIHRFVADGQSSEDGMIRYHKVRHLGNNSIPEVSVLDEKADAIICFSDISIFTYKIADFADANNIIFIPYVGVLTSKSTNAIIRNLMNIVAGRTISLYKNRTVLAKTEKVKDELLSHGVSDVRVANIGIDFSRLNKDYVKKNDICTVLMVGRLEEDRTPMGAADIIGNIYSRTTDVRFIIVGDGSLKMSIFDKIKEKTGQDVIACSLEDIDKAGPGIYSIPKVPNDLMYKVYEFSDFYINLNVNEIFGMSLLEAMYYENVPYAIHAPGPDDIIDEGVCGFLFDSIERMAEALGGDVTDYINGNGSHDRTQEMKKKAHDRIINSFTWEGTGDIIEELLDKNSEK